ncbi:hypothetical protein HK096_008693, partial [Nowakowskiella sp. JEL0078]
MDVYSDVLYVLEKTEKLASLARTAVLVDRFKPETCLILSNFYGLRLESERAITYLKRALTLDRNNTAAWTLLGHEYTDLKNTEEAIMAYRRATEINPRDYRPWYGLGTAYEAMKVPLYAIRYFQKAATLKPYDTRIWNSLGVCYESQSNSIILGVPSVSASAVQQKRAHREDAIRCFKRALTGWNASGPEKQLTLKKLASLCCDDTSQLELEIEKLINGFGI